MRTDEILLCAVLVMLIGSTYMGFAVKRSLYRLRKTSTLNLDEEVERLKYRVAALEGRSSDAAQTQSQPPLLN
jgi:hypothetical protein